MNTQEYINIGINLKRIRTNKGITQKELAEKVGLVYSSYSNYENGNRLPKKEILEKIANALNVDIIDLMYDELTAKKMHEPFDNKDLRQQHLLDSFNLLNDQGKEKAIERIKELTEIERFKIDYFVKTEYGSELTENNDFSLLSKSYAP